MEDNNSWNEMIFRQIQARKDWILALIWRKRLELENDTAHVEVENLEAKKKIDLEQENPLFTRWCEKRKDNFDVPLEEKKSFSRVEHAPEAEKSNKIPHEEGNLDVLREEKKCSSMEKHAPEAEKSNKMPHEEGNLDRLLIEKKMCSSEKGQAPEPEKSNKIPNEEGNHDLLLIKEKISSASAEEQVKLNQKRRSPGYVRLKLQAQRTRHNSLSSEDVKIDLQAKNATKKPPEENTENDNNQRISSKPIEDRTNEKFTKPFKGDTDKKEPVEEEKVSDEDDIEHPEGGGKVVKCKLCDYSFSKARADIDRLTLAVHFKIRHPSEKKGYGRLIRKLRPTVAPPVKHGRNRPDHRINFWAKIPVSTQANVTSRNPRKRAKRNRSPPPGCHKTQ